MTINGVHGGAGEGGLFVNMRLSRGVLEMPVPGSLQVKHMLVQGSK